MINTATNTVTATVSSAIPDRVAVTPNGLYAYVAADAGT